MTNELQPNGHDRAGLAALRPGGRRARTAPLKSLPPRTGRRIAGQLAEPCLEVLPNPVLLVDESLRLLLANASARHLLVAGAGVRVVADRVQLTDADAQRVLASLVAALMRPEESGRRQRVVLARRPTSARPLRLAAMRMGLGDCAEDCEAECMVGLFVDDPDRRPQPQYETLRDLYGVTAAEARLALALYEGATIDAAAQRFGVSKLTVRTQLKSLFSRMGLHSQSQLVRELGVIANWAPLRAK